MALRWLWGGYPLAINTLWGGIDVALGGLRDLRPRFLLSAFCFRFGRPCRVFQGSRFEVQGSIFGLYYKSPESNSPPTLPSGWSGGTLDKLWTCTGTIAPPQTPAFDQPHLSSSLYAPQRSACADGVLPATPSSRARRVPFVDHRIALVCRGAQIGLGC